MREKGWGRVIGRRIDAVREWGRGGRWFGCFTTYLSIYPPPLLSTYPRPIYLSAWGSLNLSIHTPPHTLSLPSASLSLSLSLSPSLSPCIFYLALSVLPLTTTTTTTYILFNWIFPGSTFLPSSRNYYCPLFSLCLKNGEIKRDF